VRCAAYRALAQFPLASLHDVSALRPLVAYVTPVMAEIEAAARAAALQLARLAVAYEHKEQRSLLLAPPKRKVRKCSHMYACRPPSAM
jgi:hypothetical protein